MEDNFYSANTVNLAIQPKPPWIAEVGPNDEILPETIRLLGQDEAQSLFRHWARGILGKDYPAL